MDFLGASNKNPVAKSLPNLSLFFITILEFKILLSSLVKVCPLETLLNALK